MSARGQSSVAYDDEDDTKRKVSEEIERRKQERAEQEKREAEEDRRRRAELAQIRQVEGEAEQRSVLRLGACVNGRELNVVVKRKKNVVVKRRMKRPGGVLRMSVGGFGGRSVVVKQCRQNGSPRKNRTPTPLGSQGARTP